MNAVQLYVRSKGEWVHRYNVEPQVVQRHLKGISHVLSSRPSSERHKVYLQRVSFGALASVLDQLRGHRQNLHLNMHKRTLPGAIAMWQAVEAHELYPEQPQIIRHIVGHKNNAKMTPEDLMAIQTAFDILPKSHGVWKGVIHRLPWLFLHGNYSEQERNEIIRLVGTDPELKQALEQKHKELVGKDHIRPTGRHSPRHA